MKKSMRMVSVIMAAVMSMSAMSALAAGASAEEVIEPPCQGYVLSDTLSHFDVPVYIETSGINRKMKNYSVTLDYEFLVTPTIYGHDYEDDPEAVMNIIRAAYPEATAISAPDIYGKVFVKVHEKFIFNENTGDDTIGYIELPAFIDMNSLKIQLNYNSNTLGEREICKVDFASITMDHYEFPEIIIHLDCDSSTSIVSGDIYANGNLVCSKRR